MTNQLIVITGSTHPLATKESVSWQELQDQTFIKFMSEKTNPAWEQIATICHNHGFSPKARPVSASNDVEFFNTPLQGSILIWKKSQRQIGLLLEAGHRCGIPIEGPDNNLEVYAVFHPRNENRLQEFFEAAEEARSLLCQHRDRQIGE